MKYLAWSRIWEMTWKFFMHLVMSRCTFMVLMYTSRGLNVARFHGTAVPTYVQRRRAGSTSRPVQGELCPPEGLTARPRRATFLVY